jgi:predicted DNA-binding protein with PD1-like motif
MEPGAYLRGSARQNVLGLVQIALNPGADLLRGLAEGLRQEAVQSGVLVSGIGALRRAVFRNLRQFPASYPVRPQDRLYLEIEKPLELVSLSGWIAPRADGATEIHAHFAASTVENERIVTLGGHLTEGTVCDIKVVAAVLVLQPDRLQAGIESQSKTYDLCFERGGGSQI